MKNSRKKISIITFIALFQAVLLVNMYVAESYIIYEESSLFSQSYIEINKKKSDLSLFNLLKIFFSIKQIGIVSAEELSWGCCPLTKDGAICQDTTSSANAITCKTNIIPTKCSLTSECKPGCCIDNHEGFCTANAVKSKCDSDGGLWKNDKNCLIQECSKGCCVLGNQARFATEKECKSLSLKNGFIEDFRGEIKTEYECLALSASNISEGACIFKGGSCSLTTEIECLKSQGVFSEGLLCSNPILNTTCKKQSSAGCAEGKDGIYWFDSCGNRENIYSSNKDSSWNNGMIMKKENSCNPSSSNANSEDCGNCDSFLGSVCSKFVSGGKKIKDGNFICKDLRCTDENGKIWKNGESWCVYDSYIGEGKDTVGSRHWRKMCIDGKIKVEPCADYRAQLCVQSEKIEDGESFKVGVCTANEAPLCLENNPLQTYDEEDGSAIPNQENIDNCKKNKNCMVKEVHIDDFFSFDMCVGKYPKGFDLTGEEKAIESASVCKIADQTCTVIYEKKVNLACYKKCVGKRSFWSGGPDSGECSAKCMEWVCDTNCDCEKKEFAEKMNDLCISLGDCGSYVNYVGKGTNNIIVKGAPTVGWENYKSYSNKVNGQFVEPQNLEDTLARLGLGAEISSGGSQQTKLAKTAQSLGTISGAIGLTVVSYGGIGAATFAFKGAIAPYVGGVGSPGYIAIGSVAYAAIGGAIGLYVGSVIAKSLGVSPEVGEILTYAGAVFGALIAISLYNGWNVFGWVVAIVTVAFYGWTWITGWGQTREETVEFSCMPWTPPNGGDDCKKCNEDPLKPCSKYRCSSLGKACKLLNEETENPVCESIPEEVNTPIISPGEIIKLDEFSIVKDTNFQFQGQEQKKVSIRTNAGECIPSFTDIVFTLNTDEYAQCRYSFSSEESYENMTNFPMEMTLSTKNHTFALEMPSIESLSIYNISESILGEKFGNTNMYVKCSDYFGNSNIEPYVVNFCINSGPDLTAPRVNLFSPKNGGYIKYGDTEIPLVVYLNEPSECKYDVNDKPYNEMSGIMNCEKNLVKRGIYGWECNTTLTGLKNDTNNFCIKCKDKPWLASEDENRIVNSECIKYTLSGTKENLKIDFISPEGKIETGAVPVSIDLETKTSGGAENGVSTCYYSFEDYNHMSSFFETSSNKHKQNFNLIMDGDHLVYLKCEDSAKNSVFGNATFNVEVDSSPPTITRVYEEGGNIKIATNEEAECYYDFNTCYFDIKNGTSMSPTFSNMHTAKWIPGKVYNIKCSDIWGNKANGCSIRISQNYFK